MKRIILVVVCLVCAVAVAAPVNAAVLGFDELIGTVIPSTPGGGDLIFTNQLITMYNTDTAGPSNVAYPVPPGTINSFALYGPNMNTFGPLPDFIIPAATGVGSSEGTGPGQPSIDLTVTPYLYLYVKYGGFGTLFYLDGLTSIDGISASFLETFEGLQGGTGVSHWTLFNPGTTQVPEAGALLMFGSGLIGLIGYRRMRRMQ